MKYYLHFISLLIIVFAACTVNAQQKEFVYENFTQRNGIPSNETYFVFEDSKHYIWVASDLGVARFNGNKFEQFDLPDNTVFRISEDSKGRIWFFSFKAQLAYFENEKIHLFKYNDRILKRIEKIQIIDAYVDNSDKIHLSSALDTNYTITSDGIITSHNRDYTLMTPGIIEYSIDVINNNTCLTTETISTHLPADTIRIKLIREGKKYLYAIAGKFIPVAHFGSIIDQDGNVYLFSDFEIIKLKTDGTYTWRRLPAKVLTLHIYQEKLWVGLLKKSAIILDKNLLENKADSILTNKSVTQITHDYEGGVWLSTLESGVYHIKNTEIVIINNHEPIRKPVTRLLNVKDSILLYGNELGLYMMTKTASSQLFSFPNTSISDLSYDNAGNIFCYGAGFPLFSKSPIHSPLFKNFYFTCSNAEMLDIGDPKNCQTFVSSSIEVFSVKKNNILEKLARPPFFVNVLIVKEILNKPAKLFAGTDATVWAGTNDGLYKSSSGYDTLIKFLPGSSLLMKGVTCIRQLDNGILAAGIRFGGVALIQDTNIILNITEKEGLLSNKIRYLLPLKNDLWVATARGISVIRFSSYQPLQYDIVNIGKNNGLFDVTINQLLKFQDNIAAATSNGIYFIENPTEQISRQLQPLPFYINNINTFRGDTSGISSISLPYFKNRLAIKYAAISFYANDDIKYLYQFEKTDSSWHSTSSSELILENLEPGTYNLQIKAVIPFQKRDSVIRQLTITIETPWWQKNWFRLLLISLVLGGFYAFFTTRIKKIRASEKNKTALNLKMTELEQTALRSQMNPHFIFNCLTSIQQLIVSGNKTDANEYLVKFARLIRKTLELSAQPFVSIAEEMDYLNSYIFLEQFRLEGKFDYTVHADENIKQDYILIPNMMVQPIVENCIRHGIKSLNNRRGLITIFFKQHDNHINCTITDNGVGRSATTALKQNSFTEHKSFGIDITQKRLKNFEASELQEIGMMVNDLYDETGTPAGTQVIIQLPFKTIYPE